MGEEDAQKHGSSTMYCFRIKLQLPDGVRIESSEKRLTFEDGQIGSFDLRTLESVESLKDAGTLTLRGSGFSSAENAEAAAARCRGLMEKAFAHTNIGANFGDRAPSSHFSEAGLKLAEEGTGERVLNDVHGTVIFESDPPPHFIGMSLKGIVVGRNADNLKAAVGRAIDADVVMTGYEQLAYELYSSSFSLGNADARFALLMMAIETMIEPQSRSLKVRAHVDGLIAQTRRSDLQKQERDSIVGALSWLQNESINRAGRRLSARLGDQRYMSEREDPRVFFTKCYALRSALFHGATPRPSREAINARSADLQRFVSELLALELRVESDNEGGSGTASDQ